MGTSPIRHFDDGFDEDDCEERGRWGGGWNSLVPSWGTGRGKVGDGEEEVGKGAY